MVIHFTHSTSSGRPRNWERVAELGSRGVLGVVRVGGWRSSKKDDLMMRAAQQYA